MKRRTRARRGGHTIVESAFVLLLAITLTLAIYDYARYFMLSELVNNAARFTRIHPLDLIAAGRLPATTEEYERWIEESGCWWLTLGQGEPEPGKWPGHVAVAVWESVLIDLTLPQANRPQADARCVAGRCGVISSRAGAQSASRIGGPGSRRPIG